MKNLGEHPRGKVLDSAEKPEEPEKSLSKDEIIEIINSSVAVAIDKAKGKLRR